MNRQNPFSGLPPAVKVILIINVAVFLLIQAFGERLVTTLGMHLPGAEHYFVFQYITHIFTHATLGHLFFNMFAVFMFGRVLEMVWGTKRFIFYYLFTGLGAACLQSLVSWWEYSQMMAQFQEFVVSPDPGLFAEFLRDHKGSAFLDRILQLQGWEPLPKVLEQWSGALNPALYIEKAKGTYELFLYGTLNIPCIGASGAVFGILLAFGMLFPNTELYLMFIPIPIKAKYFVIGYGLVELYLGLQNRAGDSVAHFAHLGGMLFGFFLVYYWRKHSKRFY